MSNINNFEDLTAERLRLEEILQRQKANLKIQFQEMKIKAQPAIDLVSAIGKPGKSSLVSSGVALGIDLLVRNRIGGLLQTFIPFLWRSAKKIFSKPKVI